jgi:hypothetical protein
MAVISKALLLRRCLYRSRRCSLLLPRALSSFVVDDRTEVHRDDVTVARHPTKRALRPTRGISICPVYCCSSGNGMSVHPRSSSSPCDQLWEVVLLQCVQGDCKHANRRGRLGVAGIRRGSGRRCSQNAEHISSRQLSSASGGGSQSCRLRTWVLPIYNNILFCSLLF